MRGVEECAREERDKGCDVEDKERVVGRAAQGVDGGDEKDQRSHKGYETGKVLGLAKRL